MVMDLSHLKPHQCDFALPDGATSMEDAVCVHCGKNILHDHVDMEPTPEVNIQDVEFIKYRSMIQDYRQRFINEISEQGLDRLTYVAVNKIHGANFSIWSTADGYKAAKRTDWLQPDESFYNYRTFVDYFGKIVKEIQAYFGAPVTVFFELYGGMYNHESVPHNPKASKIQKGVNYTPNNGLAVLDILVNGEFLDYDEMVEIATRFKLQVPHEMARGTLQEMLALNPEFDDPTYQYFNLPKIEGNTSEGYVIRPVKERSLRNGKRVIIKRKSIKFTEKIRKPKTPLPDLSEEAQSILNGYLACVTESRLNNILSHGHVFNEKEFGKLLGIFMKDVLEEELDREAIAELDKNEVNRINKALNRSIADMIRPHFLNIVDGVNNEV